MKLVVGMKVKLVKEIPGSYLTLGRTYEVMAVGTHGDTFFRSEFGSTFISQFTLKMSIKHNRFEVVS